MVTEIVSKNKLLHSAGWTGYQHVECYGLSTDKKPTSVPNASPFLEMDTGDLYLYDEENGTWILQEV